MVRIVGVLFVCLDGAQTNPKATDVLSKESFLSSFVCLRVKAPRFLYVFA